ncbi:hypothetical protein L3X38_001619 [Prunus dulcis]|uniref:Uncharacterized protein n=1 Tax=Prunus dulcis TaxID=3755 RepID=A0AAD4WUF3_PRUDU|nr:hypothetical protein L3X38_001619 [Prunus dulcis]
MVPDIDVDDYDIFMKYTEGKLQDKFKDLLQDVHNLPPQRVVENDIQFVSTKLRYSALSLTTSLLYT